MAVSDQEQNHYSRTKNRYKNTVILLFSIILGGYFLAGALGKMMDRYVLFEVLFAITVISTMSSGLFLFFRLIALPRFAELTCENCGSPAYSRNIISVGWKARGLYRGFHDICPNCGNDNRIDLHAS
jgi:predicted nucleic-acid-binding Zn-ribbon protein